MCDICDMCILTRHSTMAPFRNGGCRDQHPDHNHHHRGHNLSRVKAPVIHASPAFMSLPKTALTHHHHHLCHYRRHLHPPRHQTKYDREESLGSWELSQLSILTPPNIARASIY